MSRDFISSGIKGVLDHGIDLKLESYEDALFVNKVITEAQNMLGLPLGTTKVTSLIE